jgi:hypothetical protein
MAVEIMNSSCLQNNIRHILSVFSIFSKPMKMGQIKTIAETDKPLLLVKII